MPRSLPFVLAFLTSLVLSNLSAAIQDPPPAGGDSSCKGCDGDAGQVHAGAAPAPCTGTPGTVAGDWVTEVTVDVIDGLCTLPPIETGGGCVARPCGNGVSFSWGREVPAGGIEFGYEDPNDPLAPVAYYSFVGGDPYTVGQSGSVFFPQGQAPNTPCGGDVKFFMESHNCGYQIAWMNSNCSACK